MTGRSNHPYRWWIAALLFAASLLNYLDRIALSVVAPQIRASLNLSHLDYALVLNAFLIAYALCSIFGGAIVDHFGTKLSYLITVLWWSLVNALHSLANSLLQLCAFRSLLAAGEACFYPVGIKTISQWFQPAERTKAVAVLLLGMSAGITVAPPLIGWISMHWGWRAMFLVTGIAGLFLLPSWLFLQRRVVHKDAPIAESSLTHPTVQPASILGGLREKLSHPCFRSRNLWCLILARSLGDSAWYFYIFWLPDYLSSSRGYDLLKLSRWGWIPFVAADLGGWCGGWLSAWLVHRGLTVEKARHWVLSAAALLPPAGILAVLCHSPLASLLLVSLALFGIMAYGTIIMTLPTDLFPEEVVGTVTGWAGSAGSLAGAGFQLLAGSLIDHFSYRPVFFMAGIMHPLAALLLWTTLRWNKVAAK
jgi:ACS family hexuronate transporter-like MFS transporter